jgi:hypothetical protein
MNILPWFLVPLEYLTYYQRHTAICRLDPWPQMSNGDLPEISNGFSNEQSDSIVDLVSTKIFWTLTLENITRRASNKYGYGYQRQRK